MLSPASVETEAEKSVLVAGAEEISENKDVGESEGQLLDPARGLWPEELCLWPFPMTVEDSMMDLTVDDDSADSLGSIPSAEEASDAADSPVMNNNLLFFETWESGPREAWLYTIDENMVLMGEGDAVEETESAHGSFGNDEVRLSSLLSCVKPNGGLWCLGASLEQSWWCRIRKPNKKGTGCAIKIG